VKCRRFGAGGSRGRRPQVTARVRRAAIASEGGRDWATLRAAAVHLVRHRAANRGPALRGGGQAAGLDSGCRRSLMTRLTVAICTWNRAGLLDQTLGRLRELEIPPGTEWELLVVNNNCTDDTDAVVARHAGSLP